MKGYNKMKIQNTLHRIAITLPLGLLAYLYILWKVYMALKLESLTK